MHDTTVSTETCGRPTRAIVSREFHFQACRVQDDDERFARVLIASWTLLTGRTLRADVPPYLVSEEELISFWADDQMTADATPAAPIMQARPR